jgi:hypothetical protein
MEALQASALPLGYTTLSFEVLDYAKFDVNESIYNYQQNLTSLVS